MRYGGLLLTEPMTHPPLALLAMAGWLVAPASAQEPAPVTQGPQLREQVVLEYPKDALQDQVSGDVTVRVHLDAWGEVIEVEVVTAPPVFITEALHAAERLRFVPAIRDGVPVPSSTLVHFHFAPPAPEPEPLHDDVVEILVEAGDPDELATRSRTTLGEEALDEAAGLDLSETLAEVAGVTLSRGSSDASKPIIRGQAERRLLLLYDGIRHESQKWGPDHAPEIDPFSAGQIAVVKGASGVRYGPDAIGGVILVDPPPMPTSPGVHGKAQVTLATNGWRPHGALRIDMAPEAVPGLSFRVEGNLAQGTSLRAPEYVLGNTASRVWNVGAAAQLTRGARQLRLSFRHHDLKAGIFHGVRLATPDEFQAQLVASVPVGADTWRQVHTIERAYQTVTHDQVTAHGVTPLGSWGTVQGAYAFQSNRRREFEQARETVVGPQYDFTLRTHSLDLLLQHHAHVGRVGYLEGGLGLQGSFQENVYEGLSLIPNHRAAGGGLFGWERLTLDRGALEIGARYDGIARTAYLAERDFEAHVRRGALDEEQCAFDGAVARCPRAWQTGSVSLGGTLEVVPDTFELKIDLSSASRFPNADELYLVGSAPSFPVFGVGSPDLGVETTWGGSMTAGLGIPGFEGEVSGFGSYAHNYVYFAPELTADGVPRFDVTARGAFPRWAYTPVDAVFYGVDATFSILPEGPAGVTFRGAMVRGRSLPDGEHLLGVPPDQGTIALIVRPPDVGAMFDPYVQVSTELVDRQSRVDPTLDLAPPPPGYALLGAELGAKFDVGRTTMRASVVGQNLLNTSYRSYTSLLRYYADQPGIDVQVRWGLTF